MKKKFFALVGFYLIVLIVSAVLFSYTVVLIVLCLGVLGVICLVCGWVINNEVKKTEWFRSVIPDMSNYPTNEWYRQHDARNYDIVNIGSSSAKYAFDYSNVSIKAFNWAEQPQSLSYGYKILKTYFSILRRGGVVVISLGPFSGLDVDDIWPEARNDKYYYTLDPALIVNYRKVAMRRRYPLLVSPIRSLKELVKRFLRYPQNSGKVEKNRFLNDADKWYHNWLKEFEIDDINAPLSEENKRRQGKRVALLSDIITFCQQRDLRPVIVIPPLHPYLASKLSGIFRENYIYSFINKANTARVPFYDYMDDERFASDKYYRNTFFMNDAGAKYFTEIFLKELGLI